ncbi:hypothetical protein GCM10022393_01840 [Aquimarina addita]|uniref:Peptidase M48 domain-containing protein n=1 Tax=Aquimarina addita TaxID=870485 RepID=A0ABP7X8R2_9FLAO
MNKTDTIFFKNKVIPELIHEEAIIALSHYPSLNNTAIEFRITSTMKKSFMKAQPVLASMFRSKEKRRYVILMSERFNIEGDVIRIQDISKEVLIGWLGHELGHLMDYQERSNMNLMIFGLKYFFSSGYIKKAERAADSYAVQHGMKDYILATKDFILNHSQLSEKYKARIKRLYLSPEEILSLVQEQGK